MKQLDTWTETNNFLEKVYEVTKTLCKEKWGMPQLDIALAIDTETEKVVGTLYEPGSSVEWVLGYEDIDTEDYEVQETIAQAEQDAWDEWGEVFGGSLYEAVESGLITEEEYDSAFNADYGTDGHGGIVDPFEAADEAINYIIAHREEVAD
jgi:hypothetical protein